MNDKKQVLDCIYSFFIQSSDFNGIPLRQISHGLGITYEGSIDIVKELVAEDKCMIQSSTSVEVFIVKCSHFNKWMWKSCSGNIMRELS